LRIGNDGSPQGRASVIELAKGRESCWIDQKTSPDRRWLCGNCNLSDSFFHRFNVVTRPTVVMRQLQLVAHGEPAEVVELKTVSEPPLGDEDVLVSMEAAPLNPSDFLLVRGTYGIRPAFPFLVGSEGVGRVTQTGSKVDGALQGKRVLILPTYEQGTWADQVVVPVRNIVPMSDKADPLQLAMIGINPATAYLLLSRYVNLMPGDWIGQTAANSALGQYIIALAKLAGVKTLFLSTSENAL
jgi:NADPH:quinone reductase-like Zn-dependent oxidoreductase